MRCSLLSVAFCITFSFLLGTVLGLQISENAQDHSGPTITLDAPRKYVPSITLKERDGNIILGEIHGSGSAVRIFANDKQVLIDGSGAFRASLGSEKIETTNIIPTNALFVASSRGKYYYPVTSSKGQGLSPKYRLYFQSAEAAERAGYKRGQ